VTSCTQAELYRKSWCGCVLVLFAIHAGVTYADTSIQTTATLTIESLVEQAVTTHPSVLAKYAELGGARSGLDLAKWQYYPSLSAQSERGSSQNANATGSTSNTTLRLQQNLWTAGRIEAGVKSAQYKQLAAQNALQETRTTVALRTLEAWQALLSASGRQQASQQLLQQLDRLNGMMNRRVEQQVSPAIDAQLVQARIAQAQSEYLNAKTTADTAKLRLAQWAGDEAFPMLASSNAVLVNLAAPLSSWPTDTPQRLDDAIAASPTLLRLEADLSAAREDIEQKKAERWPSVYARVDRQFNKNSFGGKSVDTVAYLGLQYTPGAGLTVRSQIETAQAKFQSLDSERETVRRQIKESYLNEWREYLANVERIQLAQQVQTSNAALFESYTRLFVAGRRSWLELLNALREQAASEQALADLKALQYTSHFRLRLYLGQLAWQDNN
jgi:outer membrane protein, adhesin transport system